jgi:hypothetical protein
VAKESSALGVGCHHCDEGATRGTAALVYYQLHSSLYAGTVQGYKSTPDWSDHPQWRRQLSTVPLQHKANFRYLGSIVSENRGVEDDTCFRELQAQLSLSLISAIQESGT